METIREKITINISDSLDARNYALEELIHVQEFQKTIRLINSALEFAAKVKGNRTEYSKLIYSTISILGERGAGKSSFLQTIFQHYKGSEKVHFLKIIDPTMIEEKGHIFLTVLSILNADVLSEKNIMLHQKLDEWQDNLNALAAGLPSIDGIGGRGVSETEWQDPEYILSTGLRAVESAFNLREKYCDLVNLALTILNKNLLVIVFDDIDVDFRKGYPTLEILRKYLNSPQILNIVSGDIELFSDAVRKNKWKNFGKALLINEGEKLNHIKQYEESVTKMESQFLLKILKPERRINLFSLLTKSFQNLYIPIYIARKQDNIEIKDFYSEFLNKFGIFDRENLQVYLNFLLSLPIRTHIQLINAIENDMNFRAQIFDTFLSELYSKNINETSIRSNPQMINSIILQFLLQEKDLTGSYQLMPSTVDSTRNACLFTLNINAASIVKTTPHLIFDYFVKIGFTRNLLNSVPYEVTESTKLGNRIKSIEGLANFSGVYQDKVLRDIVGNINAYVEGNKESDLKLTKKQQQKDHFGIMKLSGLAIKSKGKVNDYANRLDSLLANPETSRAQEIIGYLPASLIDSHETLKSETIYSTYTLLGAIGEIVRRNANDTIESVLNEMSQIRKYISPFSKTGLYAAEEDTLRIENKKPKIDSDITFLIDHLQKWINSYSNYSPPAVHTLGKISTRFFYAQEAIEHAETAAQLGTKMHRRTIALLNSIVFEINLENNKMGLQLNNNNPTREDAIFNQNVRKILQLSKTSEKNDISVWFLSCPILLAFVDPKSDAFNNICQYCKVKDPEQSQIKKYNLFEILNLEQKKGVNDVPASKNNSQNRSDSANKIKRMQEANFPFELFELRETMLEKNKANNKIRELAWQMFREKWDAIKISYIRSLLKKKGII